MLGWFGFFCLVGCFFLSIPCCVYGLHRYGGRASILFHILISCTAPCMLQLCKSVFLQVTKTKVLDTKKNLCPLTSFPHMPYSMQSERHFSIRSNTKEMVRNYSEKSYQKINFSTAPICHQLPSVFLVALLTKYRFIWLCKRIPKEKRKGLWDKVSQESAYENAFPIGIQFRLDRISAFHTEKFIFKKYFITYILRVSGMFHLLKLVDKFITIIFPGRFF